MTAFKYCVSWEWLLASTLLTTLLTTPFAHAETELLLSYRSEDLLASDREAGDAPGSELWSRGSEQESRARVTEALEEAGPWPALTTSAVLRVEAALGSLGAEAPLAVRDASSSVAVAVRLAPQARLELRAFPFDTDYLRLGQLHSLDWGGTDVKARQSVFLSQQGGAPGALVTLMLGPATVFAGAKWAKMTSELGGGRRFGALAGAQLAPSPAWRFDVGLGYFQRPPFSPGSRASEPFEGASVRVVWRRGVDEPQLALEPFRRPSFGQEATALAASPNEGDALALEGSLLVERTPLASSADATGLVPAPAAALYGSTQRGGWRGHAVASWRSLRFVQRNERGVLQLTSPRAIERAELRLLIGGGWTLPSVSLTPGAELDVTLPAALETVNGAAGLPQMFVAGAAGLAALPPGAARLPVLAARVSLRFQASRSVALSGLFDYRRDPNLTALQASGEREFLAPDSLSWMVGLQARF